MALIYLMRWIDDLGIFMKNRYYPLGWEILFDLAGERFSQNLFMCCFCLFRSYWGQKLVDFMYTTPATNTLAHFSIQGIKQSENANTIYRQFKQSRENNRHRWLSISYNFWFWTYAFERGTRLRLDFFFLSHEYRHANKLCQIKNCSSAYLDISRCEFLTLKNIP